MSLFVNLSKSITGYIARSLAPITAGSAANAEAAHVSTGFSRWRSGYERFCRRKSKTNFIFLRPSKLEQSISNSDQNVLLGVKRRRSALRLRSDKKGLNTASMLSGMRLARLFSISAHQDLENELCTPPTKRLFPRIAYQHQVVRKKCGRENCRDPCEFPECPPLNKRYPSDENNLFNIYEAYWDQRNDECCDDPCKWAHDHPRFDDIYLKESDKAARIYMRTWSECPARIKQKQVCCFEGEPPEVCLRPRKQRPHTACPPELEICSGDDKKCQKLKLPCCCEVRKKLTCRPLTRGLLKCKKFCTPYPSFSECCKPKAKSRRRIECGCLNQVPMCDYWEYWRKRILSRSGEKC